LLGGASAQVLHPRSSSSFETRRRAALLAMRRSGAASEPWRKLNEAPQKTPSPWRELPALLDSLISG
jgi:hypothetical protein